MRIALAALVLGLLITAPAPARAAEPLGALERQSVDQALAARGLTLDPAPEGKVVGKLHVVNLDVFSPHDGFFQWFNHFHRTTREYIISRESLIGPGHPYQKKIVEETMRNLTDWSLSSVAVVVPVVAVQPETVDILIVTRDVWSLRLNTDFEYQQGRLISLTTSLSENNLFGWRKRASFVLDMDQGAMAIGPTYEDPNIAGSRLSFTASARTLVGRETGAVEGSSSGAQVAFPLYSLASRWGASAGVGHSDGIVRSFLGTRLRTVDLPATSEIEALPWTYRLRTFGTTAGVVRSFPGDVIQRVSFGYQFGVTRPSLTDDFSADPAQRSAFSRAFLPRSERVSSVYSSYRLFTPRFQVLRDLDTFDLSEYSRLGPDLELGLSQALAALGSERTFVRLSGGAGWREAFGSTASAGFGRVWLGWSGRLQDGRLIDQAYSGGGYVASPVLARALRLVGSLGGAVLVDETSNRFYSLGGDSGLRGYTIGDLLGTAQMLGHLEARSLALTVASFRVGGLVFYDIGAAGPTDPKGGPDLFRVARSVLDLTPFHDVGLGLRLLIPQLNAYVLRLDWAFALQDTTRSRGGWPGRMSLGFRQAF